MMGVSKVPALGVTLLLVAVAVPANANDVRYAADFMDVGVGVRELGMGSAAGGVESGVADWWNVSLMSRLDSRQIHLHHTFYAGGLANLDFAGIAWPLGGSSAISASLLRFAVDRIPRFEDILDPDGRAERENNLSSRPSGVPIGYFDSQDLGLRLSVVRWTRRIVDFGWLYSPFPVELGAGASLKYIRQSLDSHLAVGLGGDAGVHLTFGGAEMIGWDFLGDFTSAITLTDIAGTQVTWDTPSRAKGSIPMRLRNDWAYVQDVGSLRSRLVLAWGRTWDLDDGRRTDRGFGIEWGVQQKLFFRLGQHRDDWTAGFGVRAWKMQLDYAFLSAEALDSHRVDLTFMPWN
jgi:hypothetical protein